MSLLIGPYMKRDVDQTEDIIRTAADLVHALSELTWRDREIGFEQWSALVNALNTGTKEDGTQYVNGQKVLKPTTKEK